MFRFIEFIVELTGWFRIMLSPLLIGLGLGAAIYYLKPGTATFVTAILLALSGLIIGVLWANKVWKKHGTIQFLSRIDETPDLDQSEKGKIRK